MADGARGRADGNFVMALERIRTKCRKDAGGLLYTSSAWSAGTTIEDARWVNFGLTNEKDGSN